MADDPGSLFERVWHIGAPIVGGFVAQLFMWPKTRTHLRELWDSIHRIESRLRLKHSKTPSWHLDPEEITKGGSKKE